LGFGKGGKKTGLDLLQVLAAISVPVAVIIIVGSIFTASQSESQRAVEENRAQDEALQAYLEEMGRLLLDEYLPDSDENDAVRTLARARTLTILERVDGSRKRSIVQFLDESRLIQWDERIVSLDGADLSGADLSEIRPWHADLSGANLSGANLVHAYLGAADLSGANLKEADLGYADLREADLSGAQGVTNEELEKRAETLERATMIDGAKHN